MAGTSIDLNADIGEGAGEDDALMAVVTSVSIACGGHAGDEATMTAALAGARDHGVAAGAHPAYPDREGFGRRPMEIGETALEGSLAAQIGALAGIAAGLGVELNHVKPHGALYNQAYRDPALAAVVAAAVTSSAPGTALMAPPGGELAAAAVEAGLPFIAEGFVDRAYAADGALVPRGEAGAMVTDPKAQAAQAVGLARNGRVIASGGGTLAIAVQTLCIHGDVPGAAATARHVRVALESAGVTVTAVAR